MSKKDRDEPKLFTQGNRYHVSVEAGRADELREHLRSHGIRAGPAERLAGMYVSFALAGDIDPEQVEAILEQWGR
jgi:hypothetical protein